MFNKDRLVNGCAGSMGNKKQKVNPYLDGHNDLPVYFALVNI